MLKMRKTIIFPFYEKANIDKKVSYITQIVGDDNVCDDKIEYGVPELVIRCNRKQWKQIKRKLDLGKVGRVYW